MVHTYDSAGSSGRGKTASLAWISWGCQYELGARDAISRIAGLCVLPLLSWTDSSLGEG